MKVLKEKNKSTYVVFLLDDSVSMAGIRTQTISGFNEQLEAVKQMQLSQPGHEVLVSIVKFSEPNKINPIRKWVRATEIEPISMGDYTASGGSTALLDAMQYTINLAKEKEQEIVKGENAALILFFTDGYENSSVEVKDGKVLKNQIEALRKTEHWTFTFTGTKEANVVEQEFGISALNTTVFAGGVAGMTSYSAGTVSSLDAYSNARSLGSTYTDTFYNNNEPTNDDPKTKVNNKV